MLPKHRIFNLGIVATLALLFGILFVLSENVLKSSSMLNRRALGAMQNEDFKEAIAQIDSAIKINQDSPILYANKALFTASCTSVISDMSSFFSGQMIPDPSSRLLQEATILFAKASALSPRDPVFIHNLGWLKIAQGYFTEGKAYLQQALELAPYEPIYLISNGIVEESEGHNETATRLYTLAMISAPSLRDTPFRFMRNFKSEIPKCPQEFYRMVEKNWKIKFRTSEE